MSVESFTAAFPLPIDAESRSHDTLDGDVLKEFRRRIDALPDRVASACNQAIAGEGGEDEQAEVGREVLHAALTDLLTTEGRFMCYALDLDHRVWFVGGAPSAGTVPEIFEPVAAIALSGITDLPFGLSPKKAAKEAARRQAVHLDLGRRLVAILRQGLEHALTESLPDGKPVAVALHAVDRAVAERSTELAEVVGLALRGGRADWLAG